jgi:multidrug efflux pump subunit AcrA (membrane-fusion protein)
MTSIFSTATGPRRARRRLRSPGPAQALRWVIPVLLALALVVWLIVRAVNASGAQSERYATAVATRGDVTETYEASGTVQKTDQASVGFRRPAPSRP